MSIKVHWALIGLLSLAVASPPVALAHSHKPFRPPKYAQGCDCPYDYASDGSRCGGRSAWSRAGGKAPVCYTDDR